MQKTVNLLFFTKENEEIDFTLHPSVKLLNHQVMEASSEPVDVAVVLRDLRGDEYDFLKRVLRSYTLFVLNDIELSDRTLGLVKKKAGFMVSMDELRDFLIDRIQYYYRDQYGEKYDISNFTVNSRFCGEISYSGYEGISLSGDFGDDFNQIGFFNTIIPFEEGQSIDFWLEYKKDQTVKLEMEIVNLESGTEDTIQDIFYFDEKRMESQMECTVSNEHKKGGLFVSLKAKGKGNLKIIELHDRWSRMFEGAFLPGGIRQVTKEREEIFSYFSPGNMKPPLVVYFGSFKEREGFEGIPLLESLRHPYIAFSDERLSGGGFYIGSLEYEKKVKEIIQYYMKQYGFKSSELIFTGINMGATGAFYYGSFFAPKNVIAAKPLLNLGEMARTSRIERPYAFSTSRDLLGKNEGEISEEAAERFNQRFWQQFRKGNWTETTFAVAYMIEDDYDKEAYEKLLMNLEDKGTRVYGKGVHGRHSDENAFILSWYAKQLKLEVGEE